MASKITYCGIDLTLDNELHQVSKWIEKNIPLNQIRERVICRNRPGRSVALGYPLSQAPLPDVKLGSIYYPNNMTRWAEGWFLVPRSRLTEIRSALDANYAGQFVMQNATHLDYTDTLRMLPPRPLTDISSYEEELYILPLVDERWHMQGMGSGDSGNGTWTGMYSALASQLGITLSQGAIDSAYKRPDPRSQLYNLALQENACLLMDVIAYNLGHTIIRTGKDTYIAATQSTCTTRHQSNISAISYRSGERRAGTSDYLGEYVDHVCPAKVKVNFVRYCEQAAEEPQPLQIPYPSNIGMGYTLEYSTGRGITGTVKTFHDTARAYWDVCPSASTPTNETELQALTDKIGADWVSRHFGSYRGATSVYNGIMPVEPDGVVDVIEWHLSRDDCYTRFHPAPINLDVEELCHYDPEGDDSSSSSDSNSSDDDCAYLTDVRVNTTTCKIEKEYGCSGNWEQVEEVT